MGFLQILLCFLKVVLLSNVVLTGENDTECSKELFNLGKGFELVHTRLEQLQFSFMEVFVHFKELGEVVVNNQRTIEQYQLQTNQIVYVLENQVAVNVSQMVDYSKQILDLQTICSNHDFIREELLKINPTLIGSSCYHLLDSSRTSMIPRATKLRVVESCTNTNPTMSGLFRISVANIQVPVLVFCELQRIGDGWLVIQQRFDGSVDFYRGWKDYRNGFGVVGGEFWLGLEVIHQITKTGSYELVIEFEDFKGNYKYTKYSEYTISDESGKYALSKLGTYSGTSGNQLTYQKGMKFSTLDSDNDNYSNGNSAVVYKGAWWFRDGSYGSPNGQYSEKYLGQSIYWSGLGVAAKFSRMMIQRK